MASLVIGAPHDPATQVPPGHQCGRAGEDPRDTSRRASELARSWRRGDSLSRVNGHYVPPTVFADVPLDSPLAQEEIFGPVLCVFRAPNFEEALEIAMNSGSG